MQNLRLWGKYWLRRREVAEHRPAQDPKERLLFHGADRLVLSLIVRDGFDCRVSNLTGYFGAGVYFAESATYSHGYEKTQINMSEPPFK